MKDDTKEKRRPGRYFRYGILASLAVLVISLGLALTPGPPREAPAPAFSERARAAALAETLQLRTAGSQLADSVSGAERQALLRTVTLLTTQARALEGQVRGPAPGAAAPGSRTPSASAAASPPGAGPASGTDTPATLAAALSASGSQRLADAQTSDGGMARLLAAVGAAQVLQASSLAPSPGTPEPVVSTPLPPSGDASPSAGPPSAGPASCPSAPAASGPAEGAATSTTALAMTVKTEAETVYGYQVALARLDGPAATSAAQLLSRHEAVLAEAEALSREHCVAIPPREAGYTLGPLFLESPAAGLGSLEAGTLPVYGDLVALTEGSTRQWAIAALLAAVSRAAQWGADSGPLPGVVVNTAQLPELQQDSQAPSPSPSN